MQSWEWQLLLLLRVVLKKELEISNLERFNLRDCVYCPGCGKHVSHSIILYQSGYFPFKSVAKLLIDNEGGQVLLCETRQTSAEMRALGILQEQPELPRGAVLLSFFPVCDTRSLDLANHTIGSVKNAFKINSFNQHWILPDFIFFFPVWFSSLIPALTGDSVSVQQRVAWTSWESY